MKLKDFAYGLAIIILHCITSLMETGNWEANVILSHSECLLSPWLLLLLLGAETTPHSAVHGKSASYSAECPCANLIICKLANDTMELLLGWAGAATRPMGAELGRS